MKPLWCLYKGKKVDYWKIKELDMMNINEYKDIIARVHARNRDIKLEELFSEESRVVRPANERFIEEVVEHLSTCSNYNDILKNPYFKQPLDIPPYSKTHEETTGNFIYFLRLLYSQYKVQDGFQPELILNQILIDDFETPRKSF